MHALIRSLVGLWRLARMGLHIVVGVTKIWLTFGRLGHEERNRAVERWAGQLLKLSGIELRVLGAVPPEGPLLLVANHLSWLDIPAIHAAKHCRFVSKSDVKAWPIIGKAADAAPPASPASSGRATAGVAATPASAMKPMIVATDTA